MVVTGSREPDVRLASRTRLHSRSRCVGPIYHAGGLAPTVRTATQPSAMRMAAPTPIKLGRLTPAA